MKTSKLRVTGLCEGNSPVTDGFPAQRASNEENVSIWWRHHVLERETTCEGMHILYVTVIINISNLDIACDTEINNNYNTDTGKFIE